MLAVLGLALIVSGIAVSSAQAVAVALVVGGILLVLIAAMGGRLDEVSLAKGSAKWRKQAVEEAQRQTRASLPPPIVIPPDPVVVNTTVPEPKVIARTTADTLQPTDNATATLLPAEEYPPRAVFAKRPDEFARIILDAIHAEKANEPFCTIEWRGEGRQQARFFDGADLTREQQEDICWRQLGGAIHEAETVAALKEVVGRIAADNGLRAEWLEGGHADPLEQVAAFTLWPAPGTARRIAAR